MRAVASPFSSNEDLGALAALVTALGGGRIVYRSVRSEEEVPLKGYPGLARRTDRAPNTSGADRLGMARVGGDDATGGLDEVAGHDGIVIVLGDRLTDQNEGFGAKAGLFVYLGSHDSPAAAHAHLVLPVTTHAECEGTFTNHEGTVQSFEPAVRAPGMARPASQILGALAAEKSGRSVSMSGD